jgi:hypothetical protein
VAVGEEREERERADERSENVNLHMTRPLQKFTKVSALVLLESKVTKENTFENARLAQIIVLEIAHVPYQLVVSIAVPTN